MEYLDSVTDLWDTQSSSSGSSCGSATDIVFIYGNNPTYPTARGAAQCISWVYQPFGICQQSWVWVSTPNIFTDTLNNGGNGQNYEINVIKTIRHEVGHTVGTNHDIWNIYTIPTSLMGCTVSGWVPTNLVWALYSAHVISDINAFYPY